MQTTTQRVLSGRPFTRLSLVLRQIWLYAALLFSLPVLAQPSPELVARLVASDGAADDLFGYSIAADSNTAIIGSLRATIAGETNQGAAYIYNLVDGIWTQTAKLTANDGAAFDEFGFSVALYGGTVVVSARYANAVYVYNLVNGTWTQTAKLLASDGAANDIFGLSVALNNNNVVVGAYAADVAGQEDQGAAYTYTLSGGVWTQTAKLIASDGAAFDYFGRSVDIDSNTVIVGAYEAGVGSNVNQGAAYIYTLNGGTWAQTAKLTATDGGFNDQLGVSVAIDGDTAVVGAYRDEIANQFEQGSAYVYTRTGSNWTQMAKLTANDGDAEDYFGRWVALENNTILIGAIGASNGLGSSQGAAYVYSLSSGSWTQTAKLTASSTNNRYFGLPVVLSGNTIFVGAYGAYVNDNPEQGVAYVYQIPDPNAPVLAPIGNLSGVVGQPVNFTATATDVNAGQTLTFSLAGAPAEASIDPTTGAFNFTPTAAGAYTFTVRVTDNATIPRSDQEVITVTIFEFFRINSGSSQPVTTNGKQFIGDRYVNNQGSTPRTFSNTGDIANTTDDVLYQSLRSGDSFSYFIPLPNGRYNVELNFAEVFFTQAGQRVFSVNIEGGASELTNFDVVAAAGGAKRAISRVFPITVTDGNLSIAFSSQVSKAMISAIQITPASAARVGAEPLATVSEVEQEMPVALKLYPNPSKGQFTVAFASVAGEQPGSAAVVEVYDLKGRLVGAYREHLPQQMDKRRVEVALSGKLSPGMYVVKVQAAAKPQYGKLVLTR